MIAEKLGESLGGQGDRIQILKFQVPTSPPGGAAGGSNTQEQHMELDRSSGSQQSSGGSSRPIPSVLAESRGGWWGRGQVKGRRNHQIHFSSALGYHSI